MKEFFSRRVWVILLAVVSLVGLIVLASGLQQFRFDPPRMIKLGDLFVLPELTNGKEAAAPFWIRYAMPALLILSLLFFLVALRFMTRKELLRMLMRLALIVLIAMIVLVRMPPNDPIKMEVQASSAPAGPGSQDSPLTFSPPEVNPLWEFWISGLIVVVLSGLFFWSINHFVDRWFKPKKELTEIAEIARSTLQDLSEDRVSKNTIIRCYVRMNHAVNEARGIHRGTAMTPSEFAGYLESAGLPSDGVQGLTRVFEKVRYGGQNIESEEIKEAKQCLTSILKACQTQP